eukprot:TRINITY_DN1905_c0_g1_i1.p1 TRINITY_DN1905_c0_g1~~TRINITY_DN1905_c0_g1_i1.p1  ORF type:complete len:215 (-),score=43.73 TRINITY_DN1905_c0_g1_i1:64-708(-)
MQTNTINFEPAGEYATLREEPLSNNTIEPLQNQAEPETGERGDKPQGKRHPIAWFFHLFFKVSAILVYLFFPGLLGVGFVTSFVIVIMLLAFDFWTVKNVTGRLLVGLRWWNEVREDGTNVWIFESLNDKSTLHTEETVMFWITLFALPAVWVVLAITTLFDPRWLLVCVVAVLMYGANIIGYLKCAKDARKKAKGYVQSYIMKKAIDQEKKRA